MKLSDLFEQPQWAYGKHIGKAQHASKHYQTSGDYALVNVDIKRLFDNIEDFQKMDLSSEEGGGKSMSSRIPKAKEHWKSGGHMDPPIVAYNEWQNEFTFTDGRHRLVAAYQMGHATAPILVPREQVEVFKEKLGATET